MRRGARARFRPIAARLLLATATTFLLLRLTGPSPPWLIALQALRHPTLRVHDAQAVAVLAWTAWLAWLLATSELFHSLGVPRLATSRGDRMSSSEGGRVLHSGNPRLGRSGTSPADPEDGTWKEVEVPMEPSNNEAAAGEGQRASVLATAALLGARRRLSYASQSEGLNLRAIPEATPAAGERARFILPPVRLEDPEWTRAVLGLLATGVPTRVPPVALKLNPDGVETLFPNDASTAAPPFQDSRQNAWTVARSSGMLATLPNTHTVVAASRRAALVTASLDSGTRLLIDIIRCKSVAIDGPPVAVGATLSDVVVELASRRWCDLDELMVVGFGSDVLAIEGVRCVVTVEDARAQLLESAGGRWSAGRGCCLVVAPPVAKSRPAGTQGLRRLLELVQALPDTGLICCDPSLSAVRCVWQLEAHQRTSIVSLRWPAWKAEPLYVRRPQDVAVEQPGPREARSSSTSFTEPSQPAGSESHPLDNRQRRPASLSTTVVVRILGPVQIVGSRFSLDRRKRLTELLVYLALHREGCSGEALTTAVWPDRRVPTQTVANRLSEARQLLGTTSTGEPRLRKVSGRHILSDVTTDWDQFEAMSSADRDPSDWISALEMIRGRPFDGLSESGWALLEGFVATIEGQVTDVACRVALWQLDRGDPVAAERAVRRALMAAPWDERLYRMLMLANHASGNRTGVEATLRSLARVLEWSGDPVEGVHPETAKLYRDLMAE